MLLQSNNLPTLYWKLTKTVIRFTKNSFHKVSTVSFICLCLCLPLSLIVPRSLSCLGILYQERKRKELSWWCSKPSQAITIVVLKWNELVEVFSLQNLLPSLRRTFMCWMCRHLRDYTFFPFSKAVCFCLLSTQPVLPSFTSSIMSWTSPLSFKCLLLYCITLVSSLIHRHCCPFTWNLVEAFRLWRDSR